MAAIPTATPAGIRNQLDRLLKSELFSRSNRLSGFLRFVVEQALTDEHRHLKEYVIGVEALEKPASFDPRVDPIVRVEAGRLRAKLREYYDMQGRDDPIVITLPKRRYRPHFQVRNLAPARPEAAHATAEPHLGSAVQKSAVAKEAETSKAARLASGHLGMAVLPFVDMSTTQSQSYFCQGLAEEIIHSLVKVPGLRVVARTSSFKYMGHSLDVRRIGEELNADVVLEGSVRKANGRLRITAQLINVSDGYHLWSDTYDRRSRDILSVQDDIADAIVAALKERLSLNGFTPFRRSAKSAKAYRLYLRGAYYWNKRTAAAMAKAIQYYRRALAEEPEYCAAHAALAACLTEMAISSSTPSGALLPEARSSALRALEINPAFNDAHAVLGLVKAIYDWDWAGAEEEFAKALDISPNSALARHWHAMWSLAPQQRLDEALAEISRAREIEPHSHAINTHVGLLYYLRGGFEQAIEQYRMTVELYPCYDRAYLDLGRAYAMVGKYDEAVKQLQHAREMMSDGYFALGALGACYALSGDEKRARRVLRDLERAAEKTYVRPYEIAAIYASLRDNDAAFKWLERAREERSATMVWLPIDPMFEALRSDERFSQSTTAITG